MTKIATPSKGNTTTSQTAEVRAEAEKLGLEIYPSSGEVIARTVANSEPLPYTWGCVLGTTLAMENVQATILNERLGFAIEEGIQASMDCAFRCLGDVTVNGLDRKGAAVGFLYAMASLVADSIRSGRALEVLESVRARDVACAQDSDLKDSKRLREKAIARRQSKGHEAAA